MLWQPRNLHRWGKHRCRRPLRSMVGLRAISACRAPMLKHRISSRTFSVGCTSPFVEVSINLNTSNMFENRSRLNAAQKAALPAQCLKLNSDHFLLASRARVIWRNDLSLSLPTFNTPASPSNSPPCIPPSHCSHQLFSGISGEPFLVTNPYEPLVTLGHHTFRLLELFAELLQYGDLIKIVQVDHCHLLPLGEGKAFFHTSFPRNSGLLKHQTPDSLLHQAHRTVPSHGHHT